MPAKVIPINSLAQEVSAFKSEVRPFYADVCANLWTTFCAPFLHMMDWFSVRSTEKFVQSFEQKKA